MPTQALYLKWRPRSFDHVIGQEHITQTLRNAIIQDRVRHAYLFNGPRGTGKTTMARILAKGVNCLHVDPAQRPCDECQFCEAVNEGRFLDLIEIDAASHNGVDDVRDLREKIAFAPSEGRYKVYIIDEVHRFSGAAFDALLKTLEEPPEHAIFVLATTELDKVPATIRSRSLTFEFRRVSMREVADRLQMITEFEGIKDEREALELIARHGTGSVRDSISLLDQLIADPEQVITLEVAEQVLGTASNRAVGGLVQAILDDDIAAGLDLLNGAIDEGADPAQFGRQIVEYLRNVLLTQTGGPTLVDASNEMRAMLTQQAGKIGRAALLRAIRAFNGAIAELKGGWQPQLPLELALIESTRPLAEEAPASPLASESVARSVPPAEKVKPPAAPDKAAPADKVAPSGSGSSTQTANSITLAEVKKAWPSVVQRAKETDQPLAAQLKYASPSAVEGGRVIVLTVDNPIFKPKLEADERRKALTQLLKSVLKANVQLKFVAVEGQGAGGSARSAKSNDAVDNDPLLGELVKSGGTITSIEDSQEGDE